MNVWRRHCVVAGSECTTSHWGEANVSSRDSRVDQKPRRHSSDLMLDDDCLYARRFFMIEHTTACLGMVLYLPYCILH